MPVQLRCTDCAKRMNC